MVYLIEKYLFSQIIHKRERENFRGTFTSIQLAQCTVLIAPEHSLNPNSTSRVNFNLMNYSLSETHF